MITINSVYNNIQEKFIALIVQSIANKILVDTLSDEEIKVIIKYAKFHSVENIVYRGLKKANLKIPDDFIKNCDTLFQKSIVQECEYEYIIKELNQYKIFHLPLKGAVLRKYYPSLELRNMCDIDILVQDNDLATVKKILINLGYVLEKEGGNHDVFIKKPFMNVEMHRDMIDKEFKFNNYYSHIWENNIIMFNSYTGYLSDEDFYIYNIVHAGKHFISGGMGVRTLIDIYYLMNEMPNLDFEYINKELDKVKLKKFNKLLIQTCNAIFNDEKSSEEVKIFLDFIMQSGTFGTISNSSVMRVTLNNEDSDDSKFKFLFKRLFPSFKSLAYKNKVLKKYPFLYPYFWVKRLFSVLFNKKRRTGYWTGLKNINEENIVKIKKIKKITGIEN